MSFWFGMFGQWTACSQSVATVPEDGCVVIIGSGWVGNFNMKRICIDVSLRVWTNCWLWMFFWMPFGSKSSSVVSPWSVTCLSSGCLLAIFVFVFSDGTKPRTLLFLSANTRYKRLSCVVCTQGILLERCLTFWSFVIYTTSETKGLFALCLVCVNVTCLLAVELSRWKYEELDSWMGEMCRYIMDGQIDS